MSQVLAIVQQPTDDPGVVGKLLQQRGFSVYLRCPAQDPHLPTTLDEHEAVVIFGGPMSANDDRTLPFIRAELDWIPIVLDSGKPLLGICLGSQLLARSLGAIVAPHAEQQAERGYCPIQPTAAGQDMFMPSMNVYQWHKEGFSLPSDAVLLATGEVFCYQAFRYGKAAYGLQFHPEITEITIRRWTSKYDDETADKQLKEHHMYAPIIENWLEKFLDNWLLTSF